MRAVPIFAGTAAASGNGASDFEALAPQLGENALIPQMLTELVAGGSLRVPIGKTYSRDQVSQPSKDFGAGSLGKISVQVR